ncbi:hypothetical protein [Candidatus Electronema sp. PJ]|uniref:hypothetical protein n=1 Tax=Candidatus Electronema sp. PJ TaxID=3401572 RepID=UPI003AA8033D
MRSFAKEFCRLRLLCKSVKLLFGQARKEFCSAKLLCKSAELLCGSTRLLFG